MAQWVGMFLAPAVFAAHLQIAYVLIPWACVRRGGLWIHFVDVVAVVLALAGTMVAWRVWLSAGREMPGDGGGSLPRTRFIGAAGLGFGAMITLVLFVQWVSAFFLSPCQ
ncbi:MAG: hypothetical protein JWL95_1891 [Gemmatimonadetes bacterium]|nr:hypothetical protein [Gemmatimonadota bacterium]